jgi:TonB-dependent receptor-like protein/carboxypeptidase family protein
MSDALNRHSNYGSVSRFLQPLLFAALLPISAASAQQNLEPGEVHGVVVDGATGAPLSRVLVADEEAAELRKAVTGADGTFTLRLPAGRRRLRASVVGYGMARQAVDVPESGSLEVTFVLAGGTGTHTETVQVTADRFRSADPGAPGQQVLGSADIQNLRGVLADDPLRAVQVLPGVAAGDDLRSEFSVRGSSFTHMHLTLDGFTTPYLLHAVRAVEDATSSGSVAMINSDVLQEAALVSGGYVQRSGNRTGASVEFGIRPGARDRVQVRTAVSGTSASIVVEGPLGGKRKGSWLASGRQSYLDLVIDRLVDDQVQFGFTDAQAKLEYDLSPSQRVGLTVIGGRSRLKEPEQEIDANDLYVGLNASAVGIGTWRWTGRRTFVSAGLLAGVNRFRNETLGGAELDRGREGQWSARVDVQHQRSSRLSLEAGAEIDAFHESRHRQRPIVGTTYRVVNDYAATGERSGAYAAARWSPTARVTLSPGIRLDQWSLTGESTASPWLQAQWKPASGTSIRAATGLYQQFPHFEQIVGAWGTPGLARERAAHVDAGIEQTIGAAARVQVTVYDREERGMLRRPGAETRVVDGRLVRGSTAARYESRLDGYARGVEILVQRLDTSGISGWISYAYGRNRYTDVVSGEAFWGDLDQRHTINLYGLYRLSPQTSLTGKFRIGSNFPAPGYYTQSGARYFAGETRNDVRLPSFARLDLRVNHSFVWTRRRLTLFAEVINVLNRENVRYHPPSIDPRTFEARRLFESLLPVVPSAGLLFEF